jgi:hypothetical protein
MQVQLRAGRCRPMRRMSPRSHAFVHLQTCIASSFHQSYAPTSCLDLSKRIRSDNNARRAQHFEVPSICSPDAILDYEYNNARFSSSTRLVQFQTCSLCSAHVHDTSMQSFRLANPLLMLEILGKPSSVFFLL